MPNDMPTPRPIAAAWRGVGLDVVEDAPVDDSVVVKADVVAEVVLDPSVDAA